MSPSVALARTLVDTLVSLGVREAVLSPGSRNAPLSFALHDADAAGALRLHVRIDERTAGFLALGLAKAGGVPAVVVTTSGTATANLHPAVVEASQAGVPLLVLTADRPPELRGTGANQTIDQVKLYGESVRWFHDLAAPEGRDGEERYWRSSASRAFAAAMGARTAAPGPVHLNVALREPLVPDGSAEGAPAVLDDSAGPSSSTSLPGSTVVVPAVRPVGGSLRPRTRTVVVAGDDSGDGRHARLLAEAAGWPLLAEPSSGARGGPNAIGPYRLLLEHEPLAADIERVVVFGRATLSRPVTRLLSRHDVEVVVVSRYGDWADPGRNAARVLPALPLDELPAPTDETEAWLQRWLTADAAARAALTAVFDAEPLVGGAVARAVAEALPDDGLLIAGSSNPIRDLDLAAGELRCRVLANRGAAGIDGTVSTAVGAALAHQADGAGRRGGGPAYALLGDLTFLHDANGLLLGPAEPRPDLCLVVLNDDGGGIFGLLEPGAPAHEAAFERVFGTPTGADLQALCATTRTPYQRVESLDALRAALAPAPSESLGLRVVEVPVDRRTQRDLHARIRSSVHAALAGQPAP